MTLPNGPLVAFLGDDFTGSAATMEVLTFAGLPSVLYLTTPTPEQTKRFVNMRGIGIATTARSQKPEWMAEHLPKQFAYLHETKAPILHYKICSTLDSAPHTGSIGKAVELALLVRKSEWVSCLVAAPPLRRYQAFGHLFAAAGSDVYRLDRHPVMAVHPVTPMNEADVAAHLRTQTNIPVSKLTFDKLFDVKLEDLSTEDEVEIITLDFTHMDQAARLGGLIWDAAQKTGHLAIGSQGVEYALVAHWQAEGKIPIAPSPPAIHAVEQVVAVSGSASAITATQITQAEADGFEVIQLDTAALIEGGAAADAAKSTAINAGLAAIKSKRDPLICSVRGPDDLSIASVGDVISRKGLSQHWANGLIGAGLGDILRSIISQTNLRRVIIAGGDTSGHAIAKLELFALTAIGAGSAGASLFRGHSETNVLDGLEVALKGGQMGSLDYFSWMKNGVPSVTVKG